jgi:hypothetical protein
VEEVALWTARRKLEASHEQYVTSILADAFDFLVSYNMDPYRAFQLVTYAVRILFLSSLRGTDSKTGACSWNIRGDDRSRHS